jgi:NAD(P)H-binding
MRVLVTGASGHIGSAVVPELLHAGHQLVGLARSDASAAALTSTGAEVQRGDLDDPDGLHTAATAADGSSTSRSGTSSATSPPPPSSICAPSRRSGPPSRDLTSPSFRPQGRSWWHASAWTALAPKRTPSRVGRGSIRRTRSWPWPRAVSGRPWFALAPIVHSSLDHHGFTHRLISTAREKGVSAYVGDGSNHWPAVHTLDAATLYRLALEAAPAGSRRHGAAEEGIPFRDIAEVIGRKLDVPVASIAPEEANEHFGFLGPLVVLDAPVEQAHPGRVALGADPHGAHRGPERGPLLPAVTEGRCRRQTRADVGADHWPSSSSSRVRRIRRGRI